jgi:hypothetical protein
MVQGWKQEPERHSLARKGIPTNADLMGDMTKAQIFMTNYPKMPEPITGVHGANDVEWFDDFDQGIDLAWEEASENGLKFLKTPEGKKMLKKHDYKPGDEPEWNDTDFWDEVSEKYHIDVPNEMWEGGDTLGGNWKKVNGLYEPDKSGEYSAIFNRDQNTIQVIWSKHLIRCSSCSPCYPGQGDVDCKPGKYGDQRSYMLPPDMMTEEWVAENKDRFVKV